MPFDDPVVVVVIPVASSQPLFLEYPDEHGNSDHNDDTRNGNNDMTRWMLSKTRWI